MTDMRSRRIEIFFMFREFLSLELMGLLKGFCASVEMLPGIVISLREAKMSFVVMMSCSSDDIVL
jgi:hypothetical protein